MSAERYGSEHLDLVVPSGRPAAAVAGRFDSDIGRRGIEDAGFQRTLWWANRSTSPDAIELIVEGAKGRTLEISDFQIVRRRREGYFRKELVLPPDKTVWRATATVGNMTLLQVNGTRVGDSSPVIQRPTFAANLMYATKNIDLTEYLKPGRNCIGIWGWRDGTYPPYIYLQSRVIFTDGTAVRIDSDTTWRWSRTAAAGWDEPGFDDSAWAAVAERESNHGSVTTARNWMFTYKAGTERPADDSFMVLDNPYDDRFYYRDDRPVRVQVRVPAGLADREPAIGWELLRYEYPESLVPVAGGGVGVVRECEQVGESLLFEFDAGRLERGVYTLQTHLLCGDETVEYRIREPLVVYARLAMRTVDADSYEAGMDLRQETVVDFADPSSYDWLEVDGRNFPSSGARIETATKQNITDAIIVRENGLKYRETRRNRDAQFSTILEFAHPGDWYLMVLEYPDDRERWMGISCTSGWRGKTSYSRLGPAVITGFKFPLSGIMGELKFLYRPDPGKHAVNVINMQQGSAAAAGFLRVYHIANGLPESAGYTSGARRIGILTENANPANAFGATFGIQRAPKPDDRLQAAQLIQARPDRDPVLGVCRDVLWNLDTADAYAQYLRWTGENVYVMGCWQYRDTTTAYAPWLTTDPARISTELSDVAVRVLSANGIETIASIEFFEQCELVRQKGEFNNGQVQLGADTVRMVTAAGAQHVNLNFMNPDVETVFVSVAEELARKWRNVPGFAGVNYTAFLGGQFSIPTLAPQSGYYTKGTPDPLGVTYDDATMRLFEADTAIGVPGTPGDPKRFAQRHAFLTGPAMRERWVSWRCDRVLKLWRLVRDRIRTVRDDLDVFSSLYIDVPHATNWKASGVPLGEYLRRYGWDLPAYQNEEGIWCTQWMHAESLRYIPMRRTPGYAAAWEMSTNPEWYDLFASSGHRVQMIMSHWEEMERAAFTMPERDGWVYPYQSTLQAHATGAYARETFTLGLIGGDPEMVMWGFSHVSRMVGHEQPMRDFVRVFRALPAGDLKPVAETGFETNVALRMGRDGDTTVLVAANPAYWSVTGAVTVTGATTVTDLVTNAAVATVTRADDVTTVPLRLDAYGVVAFRMTGEEPRVTGWSASPANRADLAHVRSQVTTAQRLLTEPAASERLTADDRDWLETAATRAAADLDEEREARAWYTVTGSRFWSLLHDTLLQEQKTIH